MIDKQSDGPTEAKIRLALKNDEAAEAAEGRMPIHATTATVFVVAGLQLEEAQCVSFNYLKSREAEYHHRRRIRGDIKGHTLLTADCESKIVERRISFLGRLEKFRSMQEVYMPGAIRAIQEEEEHRDSDAPPPNPEDIKLWLPSELKTDELATGCTRGVVGIEIKLREAQCTDALAMVRARLHAKRFLISFRNTHVVGQRDSTR